MQSYPTTEYKKFFEDVKKCCDKLPYSWPFEEGKLLRISMDVYFSNSASDLDNAAKPILDALQKIYGFNDKHVYELNMYKKLTSRGNEHVTVMIQEYHDGSKKA